MLASQQMTCRCTKSEGLLLWLEALADGRQQGTYISGQTVLAAPQQKSVRQCLIPAPAAYGAAAAASNAPAEGPAMPQGSQSLPDMRRQVEALVAQDGEQ